MGNDISNTNFPPIHYQVLEKESPEISAIFYRVFILVNYYLNLKSNL